jgi:hypothetical protein
MNFIPLPFSSPHLPSFLHKNPTPNKKFPPK